MSDSNITDIHSNVKDYIFGKSYRLHKRYVITDELTKKVVSHIASNLGKKLEFENERL